MDRGLALQLVLIVVVSDIGSGDNKVNVYLFFARSPASRRKKDSLVKVR